MQKYLVSILYASILAISIIIVSTFTINAADWSAADSKVKQVLDRAASTQKIELPPEATDSITKEVLRREKYKGTSPNEITISPSEARELTSAIATKAKNEKVTAELVDSVIIEGKIQDVNSTIPKEISMSAKASKVTLTKEVEQLIQIDLRMQTETMARSGLSILEMKNRNEEYLQAIYAATPSKIIDEAVYLRVIDIFPKIIDLTIVSDPKGASVEVSGNVIGNTPIKEKKFDPEKEYTFIFKLSGYNISIRKYSPTRYPPLQKIEEILTKE